MKAVILAAGEGRRLRPFTETMPKVMIPVANKPILEYVVDAVKNSGIGEIIMIVGYKKEAIMKYFEDYEDIKITYVVQDKQLGTAHALMQAREHIHELFIVLAGDNLIDKESILKLIKNESKYSILIKKHDHPSKYGAVFVEKNVLKKIVEKPKEDAVNFISTGMYKLPDSVFEIVEDLLSQGVYDLSSVIQTLVDQGQMVGTVTADLWMDVVYPWDLTYVNEAIIRNTPASVGGIIEKGVVIKGSVLVGNDTKIYSGCYIVGPVVIGDGCEIGPNACIFPSTAIGNNSVVHPFSEIRNSVIMGDVRIGSNSFISHSIVGRGSIVGNNFSSTFEKATIEIEGEFKKLQNIGSIIGEDCTIGSHVVMEPGIILGIRCEISPMKRIANNVSSESKVM
ncbi:MAG: bifunctional sugar-1-phosphate nucleotidylyltransferase/acetyltransferase [Candidatus Thermoplasmatota archaeon]|nr:bifunctional sugar-1-phosphate nucleotidylyltransferase/acetyltransferase [Candidatus Thermoplasmatota archaeon]